MMESTRQKTFKLLGIILFGSIASLFILLLSPAHATADQPDQSFSQETHLAGLVLNKSVEIKSYKLKHIFNSNAVVKRMTMYL